MQTIVIETDIAAPPERCFLLSLSIDLHMQSTAPTGERAIDGVTHGMIGLGETVTWEGRPFGLKLRHQSQIKKYESPRHFQDVMVKGVFRSFEHDHYFEVTPNGTVMRDVLRFAAPLGMLGSLVEVLVLKHYLRRFLIRRNQAIRAVADSSPEVWQKFIGEGLKRLILPL